MTRCKPGDMAVVISAVYQINIGRIVRVLKLHDGKGPLAMVAPCPVWMVRCETPMKWTNSGKR